MYRNPPTELPKPHSIIRTIRHRTNISSSFGGQTLGIFVCKPLDGTLYLLWLGDTSIDALNHSGHTDNQKEGVTTLSHGHNTPRGRLERWTLIRTANPEVDYIMVLCDRRLYVRSRASPSIRRTITLFGHVFPSEIPILSEYQRDV